LQHQVRLTGNDETGQARHGVRTTGAPAQSKARRPVSRSYSRSAKRSVMPAM
jgi:hypothetical protein